MLIYDVDVENFILFYILYPMASLQMAQKLHLLLSCLHKDLILDNDFSDQNILLLNMLRTWNIGRKALITGKVEWWH